MAGSVTRRKTYQPRSAKGAGGFLVTDVGLAERGLDGDHQERHGHEGLGEDHAGGRERQGDPEPLVEVLPDQATAAEGVEEGDTGDDGREDHRERAQRPGRAAARELDAGQHPGQRHAEQHGQ